MANNKKEYGDPTNDRSIDETFNRKKYDSSELVYPRDLLGNSNRYGSNYVVFFINVSDDARPIDSRGNTIAANDYVPDFDKRIATAVQEINTTAGTVAAGVAGQNALAGAGLGAIGAVLRGNFGGALKGAVAAGAASAVPVAVLAYQGVKFQRVRKRLKKAIMLHMPNEIKTSYSLVYGEADLKNFSIGAEIGDSLINAASSMLPGSSKGFIDSLKGLGAPAAAFALSAPNTDGMQAATGLAPNPKKEVMFNGVDFRSFVMNYQFFPKNKAEAAIIENIILEFKYHSHPEFKDAKKFIYLYPSEFDISFYHADSENNHLPKISTCVLVGMAVDYTPNGSWATTADGAPIQINLAMQFKELSTLTKETIRKGY